MKCSNTASAGLIVVGVIIAITTALVFATTDDPAAWHIPGAAHVTGTNNTVWRTDLELRSVSTDPAQVEIDLLLKNRDNSNHQAVVVNIEPGAAQRFEDVLDLLFGFEGSATLRLSALAGEIRATSRTYNLNPGGTYGQFIGASGSMDAFGFTQDATLIQLSSSRDPDTGFRTNIGLVNLVGFPVNMEIDLFQADTRFLGRIKNTLLAHEFEQINDAFGEVTSEEVGDGYAIVRAITFGASYLTYASVIDNRTGDPIYIPGLANGSDPTQTPPQTPTATPTPTITPTATIPVFPVVVTTTEDETYHLVPASIRFIVGNAIQTSLVLCSFEGTLTQVTSSNFSFIRGPAESVGWGNCCSGSNSGARLEYETFIGLGGPAVARNSCTPGTPVFAISGTEVESGLNVEIDGAILDLAVWP